MHQKGPPNRRGLSEQQFEASEQLWKDHVSNEVLFWKVFCETGGREWPDDFRTRMDPNQELQPYLRELLQPRGKPDAVSILDVGAGPMTYLGKCWHGVK